MPGYKEKKQKLRQLVKREEQERIAKIQKEGHEFKATDAFRIAQKHYKYYKHRQTDYSQIVDITKLPYKQFGSARVYSIPEPPGTYLVKGFVDLQTQFQVGFQALNDYIRRPYRTNLDGTNGLYLQEKKEETLFKEEEIPEAVETEAVKKEQKLIEGEGKEGQEQGKGYFFNQNIRMANLGYQYDWPHRCYPRTQVPIPATVRELTRKAQDLYRTLCEQERDYHGQAVIVNYYKGRDYMIGHLDDGEEDQINPIFSFCFGLSCVFLIGYPEKEVAPVALRLEAGDLLVMSGFARVCYHGVPRIIQHSYVEPEPSPELETVADALDRQLEQPYRVNGFRQVLNYFKEHRLNVNVRQVWKHKEITEKEKELKNQKEEK